MSTEHNSTQIHLKILGVLLRDARLANNRSAKECAETLGISTNHYLDYETGEKAISLPELETFAHFAKIPLEHFWQEQLLEPSERQQPPDLHIAQNLRHRIIGAELRKARLSLNWNTADLAKRVNIPTQRLTVYELGERPIPLPDLQTLANALSLPLQHFFNHTGLVGEWLTQQKHAQLFLALPIELQAFVTDPANLGYLRIAQKLASLPAGQLRQIATDLLEITF
jgi:transcriptional regulator with XRE-family HTH domain